MSRHRFFVPPGSLSEGRIHFPSESARQIRTVLRLREGGQVIALDNTGTEYLIHLDDVRKEVTGTVVVSRASHAEPHHTVTLYQGLLKGAKFELVLQKCTEIGVRRFVPVVSSRSVPHELGAGKQRRYEAIVREAAEQCGRACLPEIAGVMTWEDAIADAAERGAFVVPWEERSETLLSAALPSHGDAGIIVGPEGGLTREEIDAACALGGHIVTLGPRVLRAETAAIVASTIVLAHRGELG